jgi:arylsulfatase A-like enzyme
MSGRLPYHVNQVILSSQIADWDMPKEMTALPAKLKQAGYSTHMTG